MTITLHEGGLRHIPPGRRQRPTRPGAARLGFAHARRNVRMDAVSLRRAPTARSTANTGRSGK